MIAAPVLGTATVVDAGQLSIGRFRDPRRVRDRRAFFECAGTGVHLRWRRRVGSMVGRSATTSCWAPHACHGGDHRARQRRGRCRGINFLEFLSRSVRGRVLTLQDPAFLNLDMTPTFHNRCCCGCSHSVLKAGEDWGVPLHFTALTARVCVRNPLSAGFKDPGFFGRNCCSSSPGPGLGQAGELAVHRWFVSSYRGCGRPRRAVRAAHHQRRLRCMRG